MPFRIPSSFLLLAPIALIILGALVYLDMAPGLPPAATAASFAPAPAQVASMNQTTSGSATSTSGRRRPASPISASPRQAAPKRLDSPSAHLTASTATIVQAFPTSNGTAWSTTQASEDPAPSAVAQETIPQQDRQTRRDLQSAYPQFFGVTNQTGEAAQVAPVVADLPLAFQNIDPKASSLTDTQVEALDALRQNFVTKVRDLHQDPQDPGYLDGWNDAAREADLKLRATMGTVFADQVALQAIRNKIASNGVK